MPNKFSIITPTHDPKYLERAAKSVAQQTLTDYEWLVLVNGDAKLDEVRAIVDGVIPSGRTRVLQSASTEKRNVGALKAEAASVTRGKILVELDHDDELTSNCLDALESAFEPGVDFVYSDNVELLADGSPHAFPERYGWESYESYVGGVNRKVQRAFPPTAASFSKIWFAPNHVRAWRKDFYDQIGGHNPTFEILDDQELLFRTYLKGTVRYVPRPLYVYHRTDEGESRGERNKAIQHLTLALHAKHAQALIERDMGELRGLPLVDLCSAGCAPKGWISTDKDPDTKPDVVVDLDGPWPWADSSIGAFRASDALEHLRDKAHTMREIHRCLVPGGWLTSFTPSTDGRGAFMDPGHVAYWNSNCFWYWTQAEQHKFLGKRDEDVKFRVAYVDNVIPNDFCKLHNIVYVRADLLAVKGDLRIPGEKSV